MLQNPYFVCPTGLNSQKWDGKWYATDWYDRNFPDLQPPDPNLVFNEFVLIRPPRAHYKNNDPDGFGGCDACIRIFHAHNGGFFMTHDVYWRYKPSTKQFEVCYLDEVTKKYVKITDPKEGTWYRCEDVSQESDDDYEDDEWHEHVYGF